MAGKKQFDEDEALTLATDIFRHRGYSKTSIEDLTEATKLSRSSLYNAFGNKEQLFLRVLNNYCAAMVEALKPDSSLPPVDALRKFLTDLVSTLETWGVPGGCLLTNVLEDSGSIPDSVLERSARALVEQEDQLREYLVVTVERGELEPDADTAQLAAFFMAIRQTIGLMWRGRVSRAKIDDIIEASLSTLPVKPPARKRISGPRRNAS